MAGMRTGGVEFGAEDLHQLQLGPVEVALHRSHRQSHRLRDFAMRTTLHNLQLEASTVLRSQLPERLFEQTPVIGPVGVGRRRVVRIAPVDGVGVKVPPSPSTPEVVVRQLAHK